MIKAQYLIVTFLGLLIAGCNMSSQIDFDAERQTVNKVIENSIGWALNKDKDLLYSGLAQDAEFFIFNPDTKSTIVGFEAFREMAESFFMNEAFKAVRYEFKEMRVNLSQSGTVAWFSTILDDINEWNGQPANWINVRYTGVLEKREGNWVITQMHFSFDSDAMKKEKEEEKP